MSENIKIENTLDKGLEIINKDLRLDDIDDIFTFEEGFFEKLRESITARINGLRVYTKDVYFSEEILENDILNEYRRFKVRLRDKIRDPESECESTFFKNLFQSDKTHTFTMLCTRQKFRWHFALMDVITGINIPYLNLEVGHNDFCFSVNTGSFFIANDYVKSDNCFLDKTQFFTFRGIEQNFKKVPVGLELCVDCMNKNKQVINSTIKEYIDRICNKEAYTRYLLSIFSLIDTTVFSDFYDISPFIPEHLLEHYKQYLAYKKSSKTNPIETNKIETSSILEEYSIATCNKLITDIKKAISFKPNAEQSQLYQELNMIIEKHRGVSTNSEKRLINDFGVSLHGFYMQLSGNKISESNKMAIDVTLFNDYFNYFYTTISCKELDKENKDNLLNDFFNYVNCFINNADEFGIGVSVELNSLIVNSLVNILFLNNGDKEKILARVPKSLYTDIRLEITRIFRIYASETEESDSSKYSLYGLIIAANDDITFINKSIDLVDTANKEFLLDIMKRSDNDRIVGR